MLPFELTKDTPYLALSGELWSVFYEYFNRNWPCYKGFLLYMNYHEKDKMCYLYNGERIVLQWMSEQLIFNSISQTSRSIEAM